MKTKLTLFSQIISQLNRHSFNSIVKKYNTNKFVKGVDSWTHLVSMLFCQFSKSQSLRDISNGLNSATGNLSHLGVKTPPSKSALSYQNKKRNWMIFRDYYYDLYNHLGQHPQFKQEKFKIQSKIFLLDSTTISLCLSLFDWAKFRTAKGAVKMHTLLDFDGYLPAYINITKGQIADNKAAFDVPIPTGSVVVADRFYNDFKLLNIWDSKDIHFVVRHKDNLQFTQIKDNKLPDKHQHILKDEIIELKLSESKDKYPKQLRRIAIWDDVNKQQIELITNHMKWCANTIGELYKSRWQVEIFFRDIKNLLHIKTFVGTSENAVMIQLWTAMITILILKYLKMIAKYTWHLSNLVAFIRLNMFVKINLFRWLNEPFLKPIKPPPLKQVGLFS